MSQTSIKSENISISTSKTLPKCLDDTYKITGEDIIVPTNSRASSPCEVITHDSSLIYYRNLYENVINGIIK